MKRHLSSITLVLAIFTVHWIGQRQQSLPVEVTREELEVRWETALDSIDMFEQELTGFLDKHMDSLWTLKREQVKRFKARFNEAGTAELKVAYEVCNETVGWAEKTRDSLKRRLVVRY